MKWPIRLAASALVSIAPVAVALGPVAGLAQDDTAVAVLDPRARSVSAEELETFADIFVDIEKLSTQYEMDLAGVESEQEAARLRARLARDERETIERHGWTEAKYDEINEIVDASPPLLSRVLALIDERSAP